jgi:hypothetical protein
MLAKRIERLMLWLGIEGGYRRRAEAAPDGAHHRGYEADQKRAPTVKSDRETLESPRRISLSHSPTPRLDVLSDSLVLSAVAALLAGDTERGE